MLELLLKFYKTPDHQVEVTTSLSPEEFDTLCFDFGSVDPQFFEAAPGHFCTGHVVMRLTVRGRLQVQKALDVVGQKF
jgi:hypothetical protein